MKKQIYLAGALTCYNDNPDELRKAMRGRDEATVWFEVNADAFKCFNPSYNFQPGSYDFEAEYRAMQYDLQKVEESSVLLLNLKDFKNSVGSSDEVFNAFQHKIPVIGFLEPNKNLYNSKDDIEKLVHPWKRIQISKIFYCQNAMERAMEHIVDFYS